MRVATKNVEEDGLVVTFNGAPITDFLFADNSQGKIARLVGKDGQTKKVEILRGRVEIKVG